MTERNEFSGSISPISAFQPIYFTYSENVNSTMHPTLPSLQTITNEANLISSMFPLWETVFYLDLPHELQTKKIINSILHLGGTVESCFNDSVTHILTNRNSLFSPPTSTGSSGSGYGSSGGSSNSMDGSNLSPFSSSSSSSCSSHSSTRSSSGRARKAEKLMELAVSMHHHQHFSQQSHQQDFDQDSLNSEGDILKMAVKMGKKICILDKFLPWLAQRHQYRKKLEQKRPQLKDHSNHSVQIPNRVNSPTNVIHPMNNVSTNNLPPINSFLSSSFPSSQSTNSNIYSNSPSSFSLPFLSLPSPFPNNNHPITFTPFTLSPLPSSLSASPSPPPSLPFSPQRHPVYPTPSHSYVLLVEDQTGSIKPFFKQFSSDYSEFPSAEKIPQVYIYSEFPSVSPFLTYNEAKTVFKKKQERQQLSKNHESKASKKSGWCECCNIKFTCIEEVIFISTIILIN